MSLDIQQTSLFDYSSLDTNTSTFVQQKAQAIHARLKRTAEDVIAIGMDLREVKERLVHGQFQEWIEAEFEMSDRHARRFMSVAERFKDKTDIMSVFPPTILYELAAPSTLDAIIEQVESGEIPATLPAIREAKRGLQQSATVIQSMPLPVVLSAIVEEIDADYEEFESAELIDKEKEEFEIPRYQLPITELYHEDILRELAQEEVTLPAITLAREVTTQISEIELQREQRREEKREQIAQLRANGAELPVGKYSCLVVDPPWPMQKIERDVRPNQVEFDYPTMSEEELKMFPLPAMTADDCHLYLWTTQKYLPMALRLAEHWGFRYQCVMTWVKNVGFTPFSWMYSTEHILFCTKGSLPLLQLGRRLHFEAKVREHSRKPDEFYELVKEVSPAPRIDVFSREKREGFAQYGNEVEKFVQD